MGLLQPLHSKTTGLFSLLIGSSELDDDRRDASPTLGPTEYNSETNSLAPVLYSFVSPRRSKEAVTSYHRKGLQTSLLTGRLTRAVDGVCVLGGVTSPTADLMLEAVAHLEELNDEPSVSQSPWWSKKAIEHWMKETRQRRPGKHGPDSHGLRLQRHAELRRTENQPT